jgi:hypothetical protein
MRGFSYIIACAQIFPFSKILLFMHMHEILIYMHTVFVLLLQVRMLHISNLFSLSILSFKIFLGSMPAI